MPAHPVLFKVFRSSLLALPRCGAFLGRLYRTVLAVFGVLRGSGDQQRRPICPYKALRCLVSSDRRSRCLLHGCDKISSQEGKNKPPTDARMEGGSTLFTERKKGQGRKKFNKKTLKKPQIKTGRTPENRKARQKSNKFRQQITKVG